MSNDYKPGLVSAVMPLYNREKYLEAAIKSLIDQSFSEMELIVVDDGSTDGSWLVLQSLEDACRARFKRVLFLQQKNQGTAKTLNRLIGAAEGEYLYRLDPDDLAASGAIAIFYDFLSKNPDYGLAVGDDELIDADGKRVYWDKDRKFVYDSSSAKYLTFAAWLKDLRADIDFSSEAFGGYESLLDGNYVPGGYLVRRSLLSPDLFNDQTPLEDHYMMLHLAKLCKMKFFDQILYSYRWHTTNSITRRKKSRSFSRRTLKYELERLRVSSDQSLAELAEKRLADHKKKTKMKIGGLFEVFKYSYVDRIEYGFRLGSKEFIVLTEY